MDFIFILLLGTPVRLNIDDRRSAFLIKWFLRYFGCYDCHPPVEIPTVAHKAGRAKYVVLGKRIAQLGKGAIAQENKKKAS